MSERLNACLSLVSIFQIGDGEITEEEAMFIGRAASDLGLNEEEQETLKEAFNKKQDFKENISKITSPDIKRFLIRRIVAAVLLDGRIASEEEKVLEVTRNTFNLDEDLFKKYIEWMKEGIEWEKRGEKLLNELVS